jgi:hypothetical protein
LVYYRRRQLNGVDLTANLYRQLLIDYLGPFLVLMAFIIVGGSIYYAHQVTNSDIAREALENKLAEMTKKVGVIDGKEA